MRDWPNQIIKPRHAGAGLPKRKLDRQNGIELTTDALSGSP